MKRPTRCNRWFFIAILIVRSTCFGHYYSHHQELKSIIQVVGAFGTWWFGLQVVGLVWSCRLSVRFAGCCSILQTGLSTVCNSVSIITNCTYANMSESSRKPYVNNLFTFFKLANNV